MRLSALLTITCVLIGVYLERVQNEYYQWLYFIATMSFIVTLYLISKVSVGKGTIFPLLNIGTTKKDSLKKAFWLGIFSIIITFVLATRKGDIIPRIVVALFVALMFYFYLEHRRKKVK